MLFRTTLIIALSAPLLVNCSAVFQGIDGQTSKDDGKAVETPIESPRAASVLGNPVEEGEKDCVPKSGYGQVPDQDEETDYPTDETPPAGDTEQNQSPSQSDEPKEEEDKPADENPKGGDEPSSEDPGKDQPVEDCK